MSHPRLKLAAFTLGVLTVALAASAETPGVERIGCCGVVPLPQAAAPLAAASEWPRAFLQRGSKHGEWSLHVGDKGSPPFKLPGPVDHALQHALGAPPPPPPGATLADWERGDQADEIVQRWEFWAVYSSTPVALYVRKCHEHEHECHRRHPPPPPPPAVPEPSAWAMLLVGTGAVGAVLRRQRRAVWQSPAAG